MNENLNFLNAIEQSILDDKDISLKSFIEQFKAANQGFEVLNKHIILIHLYGNIVLPWESLKNKLSKKIMMSEIDPEEWGYFKIMNHNPRHPIHKMDLRFFLRKLRNSIMHEMYLKLFIYGYNNYSLIDITLVSAIK